MRPYEDFIGACKFLSKAFPIHVRAHTFTSSSRKIPFYLSVNRVLFAFVLLRIDLSPSFCQVPDGIFTALKRKLKGTKHFDCRFFFAVFRERDGGLHCRLLGHCVVSKGFSRRSTWFSSRPFAGKCAAGWRALVRHHG